MITHTLIQELNTKAPKYKMGVYTGNSLWLADDATIIARSTKELHEALEIFKNEAKKNNLELNKDKTKILIVRGPQETKLVNMK